MNYNGMVCAAIISSLAFAITGCDDKKTEISVSENAPKTAQTPQTATTEKKADAPLSEAKVAEQSITPEEIIAQKMETYIRCFNVVDSSVYRSVERYASWLEDVKQGPTGKENIVYGIYPLIAQNIIPCNTEIEVVAKLQPPLEPIDSAAVSYIHSVVSIAKVINPLSKYYEQQDYKDDAFQKGKTEHIKLLSEWEVFSAASVAYRAAIEDVNDAAQLTRLKEMEKTAGQSFEYHALSIMVNAKKLNKLIQKDEFSVEDAMKMVAVIQTSIDSTKKQVVAGIDTSQFISAAENYQLAAKQLIRRIRDHEDFDEGDKMMLQSALSAFTVEGSFSKVMKSYNDMVADYNRLN
ncbi:hypothetical protein BV494_06125 [Rahnella sikkimica]|uniref:DUF3829 domain-containing protein n=2 Tax=Rahnella sikkimica TaxID=1805933 RepID=A0A2L1UWN8_9GAMM|nr:hypothetical protein BV494_06125 [Rahnella sikkimica]